MNERYKNGYISWASSIEAEALKQIKNLVAHPIVQNPVAIMPDCHAGAGATIGSVFKTMPQSIIPMAVGVDIGCGMRAIRLDPEFCKQHFGTRDQKEKLFNDICEIIPVGFKCYSPDSEKGKKFLAENKLWCRSLFESLFVRFGEFYPENEREWLQKTTIGQLGTLGGGNHFLSLMSTEDESVWYLVVHSGSRRLGHYTATQAYQMALSGTQDRLGSDWKSQLGDENLAYLQGESAIQYFLAQTRILTYARINRAMMLFRLITELGIKTYNGSLTLNDQFKLLYFHSYSDEILETVHNFVESDSSWNFLTRKGACSAKKGEIVIIPGSMGSETYICEGLGNKDSFMSCSHGAGRQMSRSAAKKSFTLQDVTSQTEGVVCKKDESILDELPGAYKDIRTVIEEQKDLVSVRYVLHDRVCVKG